MLIIIGIFFTFCVLSCICYCFTLYFDNDGFDEEVSEMGHFCLWIASLSFCGIVICGLIFMWLMILGHK